MARPRTGRTEQLVPGRLVAGPLGDLLTALVIAGAFAAFLSTSSGLVVSLAVALSLARRHGDGPRELQAD